MAGRLYLVPAPLDFGCDQPCRSREVLPPAPSPCGAPDALDLRERQVRPRASSSAWAKCSRWRPAAAAAIRNCRARCTRRATTARRLRRAPLLQAACRGRTSAC
jgi:hypothetical protein